MMDEVPDSALASLPPTDAEDSGSWWAISEGRRTFLLPSGDLVARVPAGRLQPVAHAPAWVAGLALIDGRACLVADLWRLMGLTRGADGDVAVMRRADALWGLRLPREGALLPSVGAVRVQLDDGEALPPWVCARWRWEGQSEPWAEELAMDRLWAQVLSFEAAP